MATNSEGFEALLDRLMNMCYTGDMAVVSRCPELGREFVSSMLTCKDAARLDKVAHSVLTAQENVDGVKKQMWYRIKGRSQADNNRLRLIEMYRTWSEEAELQLGSYAIHWFGNPQYFWTFAGAMTEVTGQSQEAHEHILRCWRASQVLNDAP